MVGILHILEDSLDLVCAVLVLNILSIGLDVPPNFSDESVSGTLEHKTDAEVRIILLLLEACFRQPIFEGDIAFLLATQLLSHYLQQADLAHD